MWGDWIVSMLTKASSVNEFIRVGKKYRDTYIEVFEDNDGYTVIIYCDVKPDDEVRLFKDFNRLIVCIGEENVEYEDEIIGMNDKRITGEINYTQYKYISRISIENDFKTKNYKIDKTY